MTLNHMFSTTCTISSLPRQQILDKVLARLTKANLALNKAKCRLCRPSLNYLVYIVDREGLHVDPDKVSAIVNIPSLRNIKEVRCLLGTASWYRRFLPDFATLVSPLTDLLRKNRKFVWSAECESAFRRVKELPISGSVL